MRYCIAYATVEGQTRTIAATIADLIEKGGDAVLLMNMSEMFEFTLERPDGVILCAPVHTSHYPAEFISFVSREAEWLNALPSAFVSVTLSITSEDAAERDEARLCDIAAGRDRLGAAHGPSRRRRAALYRL